MTASYTWPAGLPQEPLFAQMSDDYGLNILTTGMDSGVAKMRKRGVRSSKMQMKFMMTTAQVATLKTFVGTTISGIARFYFTHPRTGSTIEARLVPDGNGALYTISQANSGNWMIGLTMEQMP